MSFCKFAQGEEFVGKTVLDNSFILNYLPSCPEAALKVYIYGQLLCQNNKDINDIHSFSEKIGITVNECIDCFKYWDEYNLVSIISYEPFTVVYHKLDNQNIQVRYDASKYTDFSRKLQELLNERMITVNEYTLYYEFLEKNTVTPDCLLKCVEYCIKLKGSQVSYRYIYAVIKDWVNKGITTKNQAEKEIKYIEDHYNGINKLAKILNINPDNDDVSNYKRWTENYGYDIDFIIDFLTINKIKSIKTLNILISELFSNKCFSIEEASNYMKNKKSIRDLTLDINKTLGLYIEIIENEINTYILPSIAKGFDKETLLFIANYCFKNNKRTLESFFESIQKLYNLGLVTIDAISNYIEEYSKDDKLIKSILENCGITRKPTQWDKDNLSTWRKWNFTDEMILEAAKRSTTTSNPMQYINSILSNWKSMNIFTPDKIIGKVNNNNKNQLENHREYTKEELDKLNDSLEDIIL